MAKVQLEYYAQNRMGLSPRQLCVSYVSDSFCTNVVYTPTWARSSAGLARTYTIVIASPARTTTAARLAWWTTAGRGWAHQPANQSTLLRNDHSRCIAR